MHNKVPLLINAREDTAMKQRNVTFSITDENGYVLAGGVINQFKETDISERDQAMFALAVKEHIGDKYSVEEED